MSGHIILWGGVVLAMVVLLVLASGLERLSESFTSFIEAIVAD